MDYVEVKVHTLEDILVDRNYDLCVVDLGMKDDKFSIQNLSYYSRIVRYLSEKLTKIY